MFAIIVQKFCVDVKLPMHSWLSPLTIYYNTHHFMQYNPIHIKIRSLFETCSKTMHRDHYGNRTDFPPKYHLNIWQTAYDNMTSYCVCNVEWGNSFVCIANKLFSFHQFTIVIVRLHCISHQLNYFRSMIYQFTRAL